MGVYVKNLYEILNVSVNANEAEIKLAYKKMVRVYHPDINKSKDAEIQFKLLNNAYSILSDKDKRKNYDTLLDISKKEAKKENPYSKNSVIKEVKITESEAIKGTSRIVNILNTKLCPKCMGRKFLNNIKCAFCHGEGEKKELKKIDITISKGIKNGEFIYIGKINSSALYDKKLFLKIIIEPEIETFKKENVNCFYIKVDLYDAILGCKKEINIKNLGFYNIEIPKFSKVNDKINFNFENQKYCAILDIVFPEKLSNKEINMFKKLKEFKEPEERYAFGE